MTDKVYGYVRKICPYCVEGNKRSKTKGRFLVYETNKKLILKCCKCGEKTEVKKEDYGKQIQTRGI